MVSLRGPGAKKDGCFRRLGYGQTVINVPAFGCDGLQDYIFLYFLVRAFFYLDRKPNLNFLCKYHVRLAESQSGRAKTAAQVKPELAL